MENETNKTEIKKLTPDGIAIAKQVSSYLRIMVDVGIGYLSFSRKTDTLSGGEVVFQGTPQEIIHCDRSKTGRYLK